MDGEFGEHAPLRAQVRGSQQAAGHLQNRRGRSLLGTQQDHGRVADKFGRRHAEFDVDETDREISEVDQPGA